LPSFDGGFLRRATSSSRRAIQVVGLLFDRLAQGLVLISIAIAPWFFGGVRSGFQFGLAIALVTAAGLAFVRFRRTAGAFYDIRLPLLLLLAAVGLGVFQLTETAARKVEGWNPAATGWRQYYSAEASRPSEVIDGPLSLHPPATRRELGHLLTAIAALIVGAVLFAETTPLLVLFVTAAATGTAVSLFGIVQKLTWNGMIYWQVPLTHGGQPFGPFVNRNNAGGFLTLCLAAGLGVVVWQIAHIPRFSLPTERSHGRHRSRGSSSAAPTDTWQRRAMWFIAHVSAPLVAAAAAAAAIAGGILGSLSRGTIVATVVGGVVALLLTAFASRRPIYLILPVVTAAAATGLVAWLGLGGEIVSRLDSLTFDHASSEPRMLHWTDATHAISDFWVLGSGLGTYKFAYAPYENRLSLGIFHHAENQYVETLVTGGVAGALLLAGLMIGMGVAVWRLLRRADTPAEYGIAVAAAAMFAMQAVHACFDFAWYIPAPMILTALLSGAFFRRAFAPERSKEEWSPSEPVRPAAAKYVGTALAMVLVVAMAWGLDVKRRTYAADDIWQQGLTAPANPTEAVPWIDHVIARQQEAAKLFPDDGEIRQRLAELWVERYKLSFRASARLEFANLGSLLSVWESPAKLHADAHIAARTGFDGEVEGLRSHALIKENLGRALAEAREARRWCPLSPFSHLLAAELCFLDESPLDDAFYLERAEKLSGGRDDRLYLIGQLHIDAARLPDALRCWRRSWQLSNRYDSKILAAARNFVPTEQLLNEVVPPVPAVIAGAARNYLKEPEQAAARRQFYRRAAQLLASSERSTDNLRLEAECRAELGELLTAAELQRQLISRTPQDASAYIELAAILSAADDAAAAAAVLADVEVRTTVGSVDRAAYRKRALDLIRARTPATPESLHAEAILAAESGGWEEAAELIRRANQARPNVARWLYDAARFNMELSKYDEALKSAEAAVKAVPTSDEYRDLLERIRRRKGS
jgi:O-antigen ligase/tetratricopeptide (TPR) repeat protein